jgi:hypothetical protein
MDCHSLNCFSNKEIKITENEKNKLFWVINLILAPIIIGTMNTVLMKPEDIGSWKNYVGYAFFVIAIINIVF